MSCTVPVDSPFAFSESLVMLNRSDREILYRIEDRAVYRLIKAENHFVLVKVLAKNGGVRIEFPDSTQPDDLLRSTAKDYVIRWLDLDRDLEPLLDLREPLLQRLLNDFSGLRMVGIPDFFEAISWAIIGQQIHLAFAHTVKQRLVRAYGHSATIGGQTYWHFPEPEAIAGLNPEILLPMQFSRRKAEYMIGVADELAKGSLRPAEMAGAPTAEIRQRLLAIRGVGEWTADYVLLKHFRRPEAFPAGDAGLQNALKIHLQLEKKPSGKLLEKYSRSWQGWQGYATIYLWRSLYA